MRKIIAFVTLVFIMLGCNISEEPGAYSEIGDGDQRGKVGEPQETRDTFINWIEENRILDFVENIGKARSDIMTEGLEYICFDSSNEYCYESVHKVYYYFSDDIWKQSSYCKFVVLDSSYTNSLSNFYYEDEHLRPQDIYILGATFEEYDNNYYYEIKIDESIKMIVCSNVEGNTFLGNIILTKESFDHYQLNILPDAEYIFADINLGDLNDKVFRTIKKYSEFLGLSESDIFSRINGIHITDELGYNRYEENGTMVLFQDNGNDIQCTHIRIPSRLIFGDDRPDITMKELKEIWKTPIRWVQDEGYFYYFRFGEIELYIDSNDNGDIPIDGYVDLKKIPLLQ